MMNNIAKFAEKYFLQMLLHQISCQIHATSIPSMVLSEEWTVASQWLTKKAALKILNWTVYLINSIQERI